MSGLAFNGDDYVRFRLLGWGREFRLGREIESLGFHSTSLLQVLIEHRGEMPSRVTGYKPLTIPPDAMEIEDVVHDLHAADPELAIVLRVLLLRERQALDRSARDGDATPTAKDHASTLLRGARCRVSPCGRLPQRYSGRDTPNSFFVTSSEQPNHRGLL